MTLTYEQIATKAADAALTDLLDRNGIDNILSRIKYDDEETWEEMRRTIGGKIVSALRALLDERGYRLAVPCEATEEQHDAARDWSHAKYGKPIGFDASRGCWTAMLAAAPDPTKEAPDAE